MVVSAVLGANMKISCLRNMFNNVRDWMFMKEDCTTSVLPIVKCNVKSEDFTQEDCCPCDESSCCASETLINKIIFWKVDVGGMPPVEAKKYLEDIRVENEFLIERLSAQGVEVVITSVRSNSSTSFDLIHVGE